MIKNFHFILLFSICEGESPSGTLIQEEIIRQSDAVVGIPSIAVKVEAGLDNGKTSATPSTGTVRAQFRSTSQSIDISLVDEYVWVRVV